MDSIGRVAVVKTSDQEQEWEELSFYFGIFCVHRYHSAVVDLFKSEKMKYHFKCKYQ